MDSAPEIKGNSPERWEHLLAVLDDKLQLSLLEHLRRVASYHFEGDVLYLEAAAPQELQYLQKSSVLHQLELLAKDAIKVTAVKIHPQP